MLLSVFYTLQLYRFRITLSEAFMAVKMTKNFSKPVIPFLPHLRNGFIRCFNAHIIHLTLSPSHNYHAYIIQIRTGTVRLRLPCKSARRKRISK